MRIEEVHFAYCIVFFKRTSLLKNCNYSKIFFVKFQNNKLLNTIANAIDNKEDVKKRIDTGKTVLRELQSCVENCQNRFGGKSELATEDDIRYDLLSNIFFVFKFQ